MRRADLECTQQLARAGVIVLGVALIGCAASSVQLDPRYLPPGENIVFGNVRVFRDTTEITRNCSVTFPTEVGKPARRVELGELGWVFLSLPTRQNGLDLVSCSFSSVDDYHAGLRFDVIADAPTYFGHLRFELRDRTGERFARGGLLGVMGVPVAPLPGEPLPRSERSEPVTVQDRSDEARQEYERRFGQLGEPLFSLAGQEPEGEPFLRVEDELLTVETRLNGATLQWLGLVREDKQRLAWRLQRSGQMGRLYGCNQSELTIDGRVTRARLAYKWVHAIEGIREIAQSDIDAATLESLTHAKDVTFSICGYRRQLTPRGIAAARLLLDGYTARLSQ